MDGQGYWLTDDLIPSFLIHSLCSSKQYYLLSLKNLLKAFEGWGERETRYIRKDHESKGWNLGLEWNKKKQKYEPDLEEIYFIKVG